MLRHFVIALFAFCFTASAASAGPAFNCRYAKLPAEVAICNSAELSGLDRTMSQLYYTARNRWHGQARRNLKNMQKQWLRQRNSCGYDVNCLRWSYHNQISVLGTWTQ